MLAALTLAVALASTAPPPRCAEPLPEWETVVRRDYYFESWDELAYFHARSYHCAQPRLRDYWTPLPDGGAMAINERGQPPDMVRVPVRVPQTFIDATIAHIEEMLRVGGARHLFFADLNHNHMHMSMAAFSRHQRHWDARRWTQFLEGVLADSNLLSIYHSQELLRVKTVPREFLATYGPSPTVRGIDHLPFDDRVAVMENVHSVFAIALRAHPLGAFALADGRRFDISFQGGDWEEGMAEIRAERIPQPASDPSQ